MQSQYDLDSYFITDLDFSPTDLAANDQSSATSGDEWVAVHQACLKESSSASPVSSGELYNSHSEGDQPHGSPGRNSFSHDFYVFESDDTLYSFLNPDQLVNSTDDDFWNIETWPKASKRQKLHSETKHDNQTYSVQPGTFDGQTPEEGALDVIEHFNLASNGNMTDETALHHNPTLSTTQVDTITESYQLTLSTQGVPAIEPVSTYPPKDITKKRKRKSRSSRMDMGKKEIVPHRFCYLLASDPNAPTQPEYRSTEAQLEDRRVIHSQGGQCLRCRLKKQKCSGTNPCEQCFAFWNKNLNSRTIIWNECIRSKLSDVSPFKVIANQNGTWKKAVETSYFHDIFQGQKAMGWSNTYQWPPSKKCPFSGSTVVKNGQTTRDIAMQGHCTFVAQDDGRDLYFAILALLVVYEGCEHSFHDVIHTAGSRTMRALDHLMDPRRYSVRQHKENCGILVCLFYGLIVFQRLIDRCEKAVNSQFIWQEYKNVGIDRARLKAAFRILGHFFVIMCERLDVAGEAWYGKPGDNAGTHGFEHVMGICKLVSTFEVEEDLKHVKELLKSLPITSNYNP